MKKMTRLLFYCFTIFLTAITSIAFANGDSVSNAAPDSTRSGPHKVASAEYRFPARIDPDVLSYASTEIWAKVYYPAGILTDTKKYPLVVMLHGNHATCGIGSNPRRDSSCEYTDTGTCPAGYVPVPNHEGYDYLAKNLASWGFVVSSINANRGITCGGGNNEDWGLNLARGRLVLKHLSLINQWSTSGGAPASLGLGTNGLINKIDMSAVGLLGHSRGGEGVRAAHNLYLDQGSAWPAKIPGLKVRAIYEIGAVDGQTNRVLDANGTVWNQLLPMCDGDVSDLEGRYPFERMLLNHSESPDAQKSLYEVWGANHNFFNTEWQSSDSYNCSAGSPIFDPNGSFSKEQQQVALASVPAFFRSHLGNKNDPLFNQNFNPLVSLPSVVTGITQVDRDFTPSPGASEILVVEDFDKETGTNSSGNHNVSNQINIEHHDLESGRTQRVATIAWKNAAPENYFEAVWTSTPQTGRDIHDFATLDFRIARTSPNQNPTPSTDFGVALIDASGLISKTVHINDYAFINGPGSVYNPVLQAVRIPLSAFQGVDLNRIHSVRFLFDKTKSGQIYLANIRVQRQWGMGFKPNFTAMSSLRSSMRLNPNHAQVIYVPEQLNTIRVIRPVRKAFALGGQSGVEVVLKSQVAFDVMNRLPVLKIGNKQFKVSRYSDVKELKELTFTIPEHEYNQLSKESDVSLTNGKVWKFGSIAKSVK